jgi:AcrR family transcriptional regulator
MGKKPTINDFQKVCTAKGGIISAIAAAFGVNRGSIYNWCAKDARFQKALDEANETFIDLAEDQLQRLIRGTPKLEINEAGNKVFAGWEIPPSESAIMFYLRTKGKKRGYTERQEIEHGMKGNVYIAKWLDPIDDPQ